MSFYFFYQAKAEGPWVISLASERDRIISEVKPAFVTVLDVDNDFQADMDWSVASKVKYVGPAYFDFDANEISDAIPKFQEFLTLLKDKGVDLNTLRLFASGGKGFHIEMPMATLKDKPPKTGIAGLPYILKEMAHEIYIDTLDMRVYTGKKGRMWRCSNVLRSNGNYKVPISVAEAYAMTVESYAELCSAPRPLPVVEPAKFAPNLAVLFSIAEGKVTEGLKRRKASKGNDALLKKFAGKTPKSLEQIMDGEGLAEGASFQRVAMQLAIAATSFGMSESDFITKCKGLCNKHKSDGGRYNTPAKRERELRRMWQYMDGNLLYEFAVGPLKNLVAGSVNLDEFITGDYVPEEGDGGDEATPEDGEGTNTPSSIGGAIRITSAGLFVKAEDGSFRKACDMGLSKPKLLIQIKDGVMIGYEMDVHVEGKSKGEHFITLNTLQSRQKYMEWASGIGSVSVQATDNHVSMMMDVLRRRAEKANDLVFVIPREGLDLITPYGAKNPEQDRDVVWASRHGVISRKGLEYRMRNTIEEGARSDLHSAALMEDTPQMRATVDALFNLNAQIPMAQALGWFVACFMCQIIRHTSQGQFPMLEFHGPAGAGKTATALMLAQLHTHMTKPSVIPAGSGSTLFTITSALAASASIPVVVDEVKPRDMDPRKTAGLRDIQRNNYVGATIKRGNVNKDVGSSKLNITEDINGAPLCFIGEALETETALRERTIEVALTKESRSGRDHENAMRYCNRHRPLVASIGRSIMESLVNPEVGLTIEVIAKLLDNFTEKVMDSLPDRSGGFDRPCHNLAVVLTGLEVYKMVLKPVFHADPEYQLAVSERIGGLQNILLKSSNEVMPETQSEMSKVLDAMSGMSYGTGRDESTLIFGKDYTVSDDTLTLDLSVKNAYTKYRIYCGDLRDRPLYDSVGAFMMALKHYGGVVDGNVHDSVLKVNPVTPVVRLATASLTKEMVEPFRRTKK